MRDLFIVSCQSVQQENASLRLRLRLGSAPELADMPWEFLHDGREFLALSNQFSLVRYLDLPDNPRPTQVDLPLRILATVSTPSDLPPLQLEREQKLIRQSLARLIEAR